MADEIDWMRDTEFMPEKGEIKIMNSRVVLLNIDLFKSFRDNMLKIAGPVADQLIYLAAKEHAKEYMAEVIERSKIVKLASKTGFGKKYIAEQLIQILAQFGYGKATIEKITDEEVAGRLENSAIAVQYGNANKPVCIHIAGQVAGGMTAIYGKDYNCKETECIAKGDPVCRFVARPKG